MVPEKILALKEGRVRNNVTLIEDGVEAITFLRREGRYATVPRPDLILLDLSLPGTTGCQQCRPRFDDDDTAIMDIKDQCTKHLSIVAL